VVLRYGVVRVPGHFSLSIRSSGKGERMTSQRHMRLLAIRTLTALKTIFRGYPFLHRIINSWDMQEREKGKGKQKDYVDGASIIEDSTLTSITNKITLRQ